ncbi:major capsid protein [Microvirus mar21]|uniref:Major capsid protein n=1 Tax=Microvirus mar21 TaxID=2851154 RepID=A0A8F5MLL4_9VIRU|nr:major capsid protein [Microvirus mar21]
MSRNQNERFALNPTNIDISRSKFERNSSVKTTFNVGDIVPFYLDEVLPGDTFSIDTSKIVRLQTPLTPIMDSIYLDTYYFFVPNRLVWDHWRELNGENTKSAWLPETTYTVPQLTAPAGGWQVGTIADYFGIPTGVAGLSVNAMPFRAYALICNEWFRDENLTDPLLIPTDDATVAGVNTGSYVSDVAKGGKPFIAAKFHDYFTSALPSPQKGPDVLIDVAAGEFPITGNGKAFGLTDGGNSFFGAVTSGTGSPRPVAMRSGAFNVDIGSGSTSGDYSGSATHPLGVPTLDQLSAAGLDPSATGLVANLNQVTVASINQLRTAFQLQKLYEKDARGGTRYIEILKAHFGVTSPDARLQRPEYLGGNRVPININQVLQQSATAGSGENTYYLGDTGAYSLTSDTHSDFTRSFVEHGYIIGLMVARYDHSYQQGLARTWTRKDRFDYYWPVFANLGEQAIKNVEIYAQGNAQDDEVFGYQEAWADYRYKPSIVTGEMRSQFARSLDVWHLADDYDTLPSLSDAWIREDKANVDRVLSVTSTLSNQLFCDIYIANNTTRPMPLYSIPGLIDHH